ncbi:hypothetical protein ACWGTI_03430 [Mesorhizobium sp. ArgA1]
MKRRTSKAKRYRITPEAIAYFKAGDEIMLDRALGIRPWEPSPLFVNGPTPPDWARPTDSWSVHWDEIWELRQQLEAAK